MSIQRHIFRYCLLLVLVFLSPTIAIAFSMQAEQMQPDEIQRFQENLAIQVFIEQRAKSPICCFDVRDDGVFVIGHSNGASKTVEVFESDGSFCYGFTFTCPGDFALLWRDTVLAVYFIRESVAADIDSDGVITNAICVPHSAQNQAYLHQEVLSPQKQVGVYEYALESDIPLLPTYVRLVQIGPEGQETVLYDDGGAQKVHAILMMVLIAAALIASLATAINYRKSQGK